MRIRKRLWKIICQKHGLPHQQHTRRFSHRQVLPYNDKKPEQNAMICIDSQLCPVRIHRYVSVAKIKHHRFIRFQMIFNLLHRATGKTFCRCPKPCPEYRNQHITPLTELAIQRLLWRTSHTGGRIFFPSQWKKHAFSLRCVMTIPLRQSLHNLCSKTVIYSFTAIRYTFLFVLSSLSILSGSSI